MFRPSKAAFPIFVAALVGVSATGCKKNSVKVKPNEIPPTETTTPAPPPAGTDPTPGKVPPPTSPTTPPKSDPVKTSQAPQGRVRILYAATETPAIDITARGVPGAIVERLAPGTGTEYAALPATRINLRATASDAPRRALFGPGDLAFAPGRDNTVVALGRNGALTPLVLTDDNTPPAAGRAKIRLVHAAAAQPALRVLLDGGCAAALPLDPGTATSAYAEVAAGNRPVALMRDAPDGATSPDAFSLDLRAGGVYTVVIADGSGSSALRLQVYRDN